MTKFLKVIAIGVLLVAVTACAWASEVRNQTDILSGLNNDVKEVSVHTVVTLGVSIFTYTYTLTYTQGTAAIHIYSVDNPNNVLFSAPATNSGFVLPVYAPYSMIQWGDNSGPFISQGETKWFSYESNHAPQDINVYAYAMDGGAYAEGSVPGMGATIPEPGSFAALAIGLLGVSQRLWRRRK